MAALAVYEWNFFRGEPCWKNHLEHFYVIAVAEFAMTMLPYERLDAGRETGPRSAKHRAASSSVRPFATGDGASVVDVTACAAIGPDPWSAQSR